MSVLKKILETKFDGDRYLEIDPGRYLAIDDEGHYVISAEPLAIRGTPYGGPEGMGMRVPFGGGRLGDYRTFAIDRGDNVDIVSIGILYMDNEWIWVAGDKIRREDEEVDDDEREEYFPMMIAKYPKHSPQNMSEKQVLDGVEKQSFDIMRADMERAGIEPPDDSYFCRDMSWVRKQVKAKAHTMECYRPFIERIPWKRMHIRRRNICLFRKRHMCPLMIKPKTRPSSMKKRSLI